MTILFVLVISSIYSQDLDTISCNEKIKYLYAPYNHNSLNWNIYLFNDILKNCPEQEKYILSIGFKLYRFKLIALDSLQLEQKNKYLDTIFHILDKRLKYDGDTAKVNRKKAELLILIDTK